MIYTIYIRFKCFNWKVYVFMLCTCLIKYISYFYINFPRIPQLSKTGERRCSDKNVHDIIYYFNKIIFVHNVGELILLASVKLIRESRRRFSPLPPPPTKESATIRYYTTIRWYTATFIVVCPE